MHRPLTLVIFDHANIVSVRFVGWPSPLAHVFSLISRILQARADVAALSEQRHLNVKLSNQPQMVAGRLANSSYLFANFACFWCKKGALAYIERQQKLKP